MSAIKVRFAPSPTGYMHIGNTRTAIFNWLLARKNGGHFMLRIDDTDKERSKPEYEKAIRESLEWLGLGWDSEAKQSERFERYEEVTKKLIEHGRIYPCYETAEELDMMRKKLMTKGLPPIYDRSALKLSAEQIATYEKEGRKPHYRFKLNDGDIVWQDMIRGECKYEAKNLSDPVIIRADGSYLYHLPSVIDDSDFGITHIVRGEDHVTNTAAQIQMFEAIGGKVPTFAHLPLLTGQEGKLSKRLGSIGVLDLKERGIEPMAISSYLAKLGTSEGIFPFYDLQSLAMTLDFHKIGRAQPKFSEEELAHFSKHLVRNMPFAAIKDRVDLEEKFWETIKGNLDIVSDCQQWVDICCKEVKPVIENADLCKKAADLLPQEPWNDDTFAQWTSEIKAQTGAKGKELFHPLRLAITAKDAGPELKTLLPLIGYERVYKRLNGIVA